MEVTKLAHSVLNYFYRGNNISNIKEIAKLQSLPLLRALVLMGKCADFDLALRTGPFSGLFTVPYYLVFAFAW